MRVAPPIRIPSRVMSDGGAFRDALKATSGGLKHYRAVSSSHGLNVHEYQTGASPIITMS